MTADVAICDPCRDGTCDDCRDCGGWPWCDCEECVDCARPCDCKQTGHQLQRDIAEDEAVDRALGAGFEESA